MIEGLPNQQGSRLQRVRIIRFPTNGGGHDGLFLILHGGHPNCQNKNLNSLESGTNACPFALNNRHEYIVILLMDEQLKAKN